MGRQSWEYRTQPEKSRQGRLKVAKEDSPGILDLKSGFSAVPAGLRGVSNPPRTGILGYTQPSLRD